MNPNRRDFLEFMGRGTLALAGSSLIGPLSSCATAPMSASAAPSGSGLRPILPSSEDRMILAEGLDHSVVAMWDEVINPQGEKFGFNCDYLAFFPEGDGQTGLLWVNHEYPNPFFVSGYKRGDTRTREQVAIERECVGGSIIKVARSGGKWRLVPNDPLNRRLTATTRIPFSHPHPVAGVTVAEGTLANCAGGVTPWGTVLTCEENYQDYYGEVDLKGKRRAIAEGYSWQLFHDNRPEHYGWVVEIDPRTGQAKKLVALGRFAHEGATVVIARDQRPVAYMGDDASNQFLYKFVGSRPGSLETGMLFVANLEKGEWIPLDWKKDKRLHKAFKSETEMLIQTREAGRLVGATPLDRPEDIKADPVSGHVILALTNNKGKRNYHGSLLKLVEKDRDPLATRFEAITLLAGGPQTGFSCPDNLAFDRKGNLWMTSDMSGLEIGKPPYAERKNNGLFYIPMSGPEAGKVFQLGSSPVDAELTGPCFSPDGKTLFLSVQHPGENTDDLSKPTSRWPEGGTSRPRPSVIAITGPLLESLTS